MEESNTFLKVRVGLIEEPEFRLCEPSVEVVVPVSFVLLDRLFEVLEGFLELAQLEVTLARELVAV